MKGSLYIIAAPSGAGKTSLVSKLIELDKHIQVSVSSTTRNIRPSEKDGVDYHFVTPEVFKEKIHEGDFLEYAEVFGNFYGTSKSTVKEMLDKGKDVILEIDWQGARQIRTALPDTVSIFILPPSLKELRKRLTGRGTDSEEVIEGRMSKAIDEMIHYDEFDYLVINNHFHTALEELHTIFASHRLKLENQQAKHANLIKEMIYPQPPETQKETQNARF